MRSILKTSLATVAAGALMAAGIVSAQDALQRLEERQFGPAKKPLVIDPNRVKEPEKAAERGYLGVVTNDDEKGQGVRVVEILKGSPAEAAGLKVGDLITAIGEKPVRQETDVPEATKGAGPGAKLGITVVRDGAARTILVTLGRRPADADLPPPPLEKRPDRAAPPPEPQPADAQPGRPPMPPPPAAAEPPKLGVMMRSYSEDPRFILGRLPIRGVLVLEVLANTPAAAAGLRTGDVIVAVDRTAVGSTEELRAVLGALAAGTEVEVTYHRGATPYRQTIRLAGDGAPPAARPPVVVAPAASDRQRIEQLERRVAELERRLAELERRIEPEKKPEPAKE